MGIADSLSRSRPSTRRCELPRLFVDVPGRIRDDTAHACRTGVSLVSQAHRVGAARTEDLFIEERRDSERRARHDQRELNGVEAQIAALRVEPEFWEEMLTWGLERLLLSPTDFGVLRMAANRRGKKPSDKQSVRVLETLRRFQAERFAGELSPDLWAASARVANYFLRSGAIVRRRRDCTASIATIPTLPAVGFSWSPSQQRACAR